MAWECDKVRVRCVETSAARGTDGRKLDWRVHRWIRLILAKLEQAASNLLNGGI